MCEASSRWWYARHAGHAKADRASWGGPRAPGSASRSCRLRQARSKSNIAGRIEARRFDALDATDDALKAAFVDEVLEQDDEGFRLDECALLERARSDLPVWRINCGNN
jgi:hypothetical protein